MYTSHILVNMLMIWSSKYDEVNRHERWTIYAMHYVSLDWVRNPNVLQLISLWTFGIRKQGNMFGFCSGNSSSGKIIEQSKRIISGSVGDIHLQNRYSNSRRNLHFYKGLPYIWGFQNISLKKFIRQLWHNLWCHRAIFR